MIEIRSISHIYYSVYARICAYAKGLSVNVNIHRAGQQLLVCSVKQISSNLDWKLGEFRLHIYLVRGYFSFGRQVFRGNVNASDTIYMIPWKNSYFTIRKWKILSLISNETRGLNEIKYYFVLIVMNI